MLHLTAHREVEALGSYLGKNVSELLLGPETTSFWCLSHRRAAKATLRKALAAIGVATITHYARA